MAPPQEERSPPRVVMIGRCLWKSLHFEIMPDWVPNSIIGTRFCQFPMVGQRNIIRLRVGRHRRSSRHFGPVLLRCSGLIFLEARMVPAPVTTTTMATLLG
jgi:hypothetical protein